MTDLPNKKPVNERDEQMHEQVFDALRDIANQLTEQYPELESVAFVGQFMPKFKNKDVSILTFGTSLDQAGEEFDMDSQKAYAAASTFMQVAFLNKDHAKTFVQVYGVDRFFDEVLPMLAAAYPNSLELMAHAVDFCLDKDSKLIKRSEGSLVSTLNNTIERADQLAEKLIKLAMSTTTDEEFENKKLAVFESLEFDLEQIPDYLIDGVTRDVCLSWLADRHSDAPLDRSKLN